jgi:hypothetical protein
MKLVADWRRVLRHAWSIRLILVAALLSGAEVALPLIGGFLPIPVGLFALLSFLVTVAAFVARFLAQPKMKGDDA